VDRNGDEIGDVEDLMVDSRDTKVRFLQVGAGGFLGIGEKKFLVPVDTITRIDQDTVHIDKTREHVIGAPDYDPAMVDEDRYFSDLYGYYGCAPYWATGYAYPGYPYYPIV
jgi:sporulation protein YlmC with PRC-barrel domain